MPDEEGKNTLMEIKKFLSTPDNPVGTAEMSEFWKSLSDEEKEDFKTTELPQSE
jgi:hypothetical protein